MKGSRRFLAVAAITAAVCTSCTMTRNPGATQSPGELAFRRKVKPLLEHHCVHCHSDQKPLADLNFQKRATVLDPEKAFVVPGQAEDSRLYRAVSRENAHPRVMPGDGWGITSEQKAALKTWIEEGAPWPEGRAGRIRKKNYQVEIEDYL